jgi:Spy/CpxP family protein refolding chaperone
MTPTVRRIGFLQCTQPKEKTMNTRLTKSLVILTLGGLLAAGSAAAQNQNQGQKGLRDWQKGPPSIEVKLARVSEALDLSDEQTVDMLLVLQEQERKRDALQDQTMVLLGPEICAHRSEAEEAMTAILTPEQIETFMQIRQERQDKARQRNRGGRGALDCSSYEGG